MTPAEIWKKLTPSQRATLLDEAAALAYDSFDDEDLVRAGLKKRGHVTPAFTSGAARHALGRKGLIAISPTVSMPTSAAGFHTPRAVTALGRAVADHGLALLRAPISR